MSTLDKILRSIAQKRRPMFAVRYEEWWESGSVGPLRSIVQPWQTTAVLYKEWWENEIVDSQWRKEITPDDPSDAYARHKTCPREIEKEKRIGLIDN